MEEFTVSILLTKEEYAAAVAHRVPFLSWATPTGLLCMIGGMVVWGHELGTTATLGLLLLGLMLAMVDAVFFPMLARFHAAAAFDRKRAEALNLTFREDAVTVASEWVVGTVAYTNLTAAEETVHFFYFQFGHELWLCVPRRALSDRQIHAMQTLCEPRCFV